ncbi:MAG: HK97-gp10 family putative phage morphogenesis protein [Terriglobales bacterium]
MANNSVDIVGLKEFGVKLDLLPKEVEKRIVRTSLKAGVEVFRRGLRSKAPVRKDGGPKKLKAGKTRAPGYLQKHIGRWFVTDAALRLRGGSAKSEAEALSKIGSEHFAALVTGPTASAFYGLFVEKGHRNVPRGHALTRRALREEFGGSSTPAHPWLRPVFDELSQAAIDAFVYSLTTQIIAMNL